MVYTASSDGTVGYTDLETGSSLSLTNLNPDGWQVWNCFTIHCRALKDTHLHLFGQFVASLIFYLHYINVSIISTSMFHYHSDQKVSFTIDCTRFLCGQHKDLESVKWEYMMLFFATIKIKDVEIHKVVFIAIILYSGNIRYFSLKDIQMK